MKFEKNLQQVNKHLKIAVESLNYLLDSAGINCMCDEDWDGEKCPRCYAVESLKNIETERLKDKSNES